MLKSLSIRNVILIDSLDIDFSKGLTVLTGETGAGKSILLDSLGLLLGNRSETSMIRVGADKLSVTGVFEVSGVSKIKEIAEEYELDFSQEVIIKRVISLDGKNKIFFNDQLITLKLLKEISQYLIEIHGQHDNQGLLNSSFHCEILDNYGGYIKALEQTKTAYRTYKKSITELQEKEEALNKAKEDKENMEHWVQELKKVAPKKGEEEYLSARRSELMNAEKIIEKLNQAYSYLNGNISILEQISKAEGAISRANQLVNNKYADIEQDLETAIYSLNEAMEKIESSSSDISLNENEINDVETRIFTLKDLAKKHQVSIEMLPEKLEEMEGLLHNLESNEDILHDLREKVDVLYNDYKEKAENLSQMRKNAAKELDKNITKELPPLKMEKATFQTTIKCKNKEDWNELGKDSICFEVSTNPNTPLGPLNKIASGGELSRFMLALKVNLAQKTSQETLIFDEIDTGIGGATAEAVGERLSRLAKNVQVLVVTHSPQVASFSDTHFKVSKTTKKNITTTNLIELKSDEKVEEIARMLAGETISKEARAAASVLLNKDEEEPYLF